MKQFMAIFLGSANGSAMSKWNALDENTRKELVERGKAAWMDWGIKYKDSIVFNGSPLGKTKLVNREGISEIKNLLAAFTVVQAESHEAAAKMFLNHPHFTIFPGESAEIMECLPIPT